MEKTLESPLDCKQIKPVNHKGSHPWIFIGKTDSEAEAPIHLPFDAKSWLTGKDRCWERLKAGGERDNRGWDGWMASLTLWIWVWVNSGSRWWTGEPGVLQSMGSQRIGHDWVTELNWTEPVFLPGESHGQRRLAGCSPWGRRVRHNWAQEEKAPLFFPSLFHRLGSHLT